jgi:hypothetical protein
MFEAFAKGDLDRLLETVHPDSRWTYVGANPRPAKRVYVGRRDVREFFGKIIQNLHHNIPSEGIRNGKRHRRGDRVRIRNCNGHRSSIPERMGTKVCRPRRPDHRDGRVQHPGGDNTVSVNSQYFGDLYSQPKGPIGKQGTSMSERGVEDVDLLVIGGGKAGKSLAMDRAKAGWKVVMVERDKIGGTCINVACIPTKALVGSARTVLMASHAKLMGVELGGEPMVSVDALRQHKSSVVAGMVAAHKKLFADSGMDFILGTARFIGPRTVTVETHNETIRLLRGTDVVINTGTTPAIPDLAGITEARVWTSETILRLERLPQRLIVLGGGYVRCEFASMFALFGTQVTLLPRAGSTASS